MKFHYLSKISKYILVIFLACISTTLMFSCERKKKEIIESQYNPEITPTVRTHNDTMYISDSGIIRYKAIAKTTMIFDRAKEPYSLFPDGAYMEQYDTLMNIVTTVRADSAWNFSKKGLWKLRGNVNIVNDEGVSFDSDELYLDEKQDRVYSDLYVVIRKPMETTMRAYGFESNQSMTEYTFRRATNVDIYVKEENEAGEGEESQNAEK